MADLQHDLDALVSRERLGLSLADRTAGETGGHANHRGWEDWTGARRDGRAGIDLARERVTWINIAGSSMGAW